MNNLAIRFKLKSKSRIAFAKSVADVRKKRSDWKCVLADSRAIVLAGTSDSAAFDKAQVTVLKLQAALDRTSRKSYIRYRKVCSITGRSRGIHYGICRGFFRHHASRGNIAGFKKV